VIKERARQRREQEQKEEHERHFVFEEYLERKDIMTDMSFNVFYEIWRAVKEYQHEVYVDGRAFEIDRGVDGIKIRERIND